MGKPILLEELLYSPDNSFIKQSYNPQLMSHMLNLAGFGMIAWDKDSHSPALPYAYKTTELPFHDANLHNLAKKITPDCLVAHLRGVGFSDKDIISLQNIHPFIFPGESIGLAHNGQLDHFDCMKYGLLDYIDKRYQQYIKGTTDSEWIYALFITQYTKQKNKSLVTNIIQALQNTLEIIQKIRHKYKISTASPVNLFISNGKFIAALRFVFDYGWYPLDAEPSTHFSYHSLWYTFGESYGLYNNEYKMNGASKKSSIIIASEPLTADSTTWIEVPEYSMIVAEKKENEIRITAKDILI